MSKPGSFISSSDRYLKIAIVLAEVIIFWGLIAAFLFGTVMPQYSQGYNASLIDKMSRLESIEGPKIVLIGDSNVAYGFRSELLEEEFGMPVVNMGLHGGIGNAFHEEMAKVNVSEGDIVVVAPVFWADQDDLDNEVLVWITIENHYDLWKLLRAKDIVPMIKAYPAYLKECMKYYLNGNGNELVDWESSRGAFNKYGDNVYSVTHEQHWKPSDQIGIYMVNDKCSKRMNALNAYLQERGAVLLLAGWPIPDCEYTPDREKYDAFEKTWHEKMEAPVISDLDDYFYDVKYFYNTAHHLTNEGAIMRTEQLIKDMNAYFDRLEGEKDG